MCRGKTWYLACSYHVAVNSYVGGWIKRDQFDVTCFIISIFSAQHISDVNTSILRSLRLFVELFHGLYCSVRIEVFALVYLFSGECLVVTCVVVWESVFLKILAAAVSYGQVSFVCSVFFDDVSWTYSDVMYMSLHVPGSMHVGVTLWFGWGGVVKVFQQGYCTG